MSKDILDPKEMLGYRLADDVSVSAKAGLKEGKKPSDR